MATSTTVYSKLDPSALLIAQGPLLSKRSGESNQPAQPLTTTSCLQFINFFIFIQFVQHTRINLPLTENQL